MVYLYVHQGNTFDYDTRYLFKNMRSLFANILRRVHTQFVSHASSLFYTI